MILDGRKLQDIILVDNRAIGFAGVHLTNGIPIMDYEGDQNDTELWGLTDYLISSFIKPLAHNQPNDTGNIGFLNDNPSMKPAFDARAIIKRDFHLEKILVKKAKLREKSINKQRNNLRT